MATDYFTMMRDVVGSYADGKEESRLRQRQIDADARAQTVFDQQQQDRTREVGLRKGVDDAYANADTLQKIGAVNYAGETGARGVQTAEGDYAREANRMGLSRSELPMGAAAVNASTRPATERDFNSAQMGIALAKRDDAGVERHRLAGKELDWKDSYTQHAAAWDQMSDADKQGQIKGASDAANIPGHGTWVNGTGKKEGYMWYTPPGNDPVRLSNREAKDFYVLSNLSALDPLRAKAEMEKASDKVRAVYASVFAEQSKAAEVTGANAFHMGIIENGRERNANALEMAGARNDLSRIRLEMAQNNPKRGAPVQMVNAQGEAVLMQPVRGNDGALTYEPVDLPKGLRYPKQVDPARVQALAASIEGKPMPGLDTGGKRRAYGPEEAYIAAQRLLYSEPGTGGPKSATDLALARRGGAKETAPAELSLTGLSRSQLQAIARKPVGVSSAQAAQAQSALDQTDNGDRLGPW